jgi:FKBP-type peptidyl-prolyl cis-trans isomerase
MSRTPEITVLKKGDEENFPTDGHTVEVEYKGLLSNGKQFENSNDMGNGKFYFKVGNGDVIPCWDYAIRKMSVGSKIKVTCPSEMAYGKYGVPGKVPMNEDIKFYIRLFKYK